MGARARDAGAIAFCHIVGLGLGDWQLDDCQTQIQADAYGAAAQRMALPNIGQLNFSCFGASNSGQITCGGVVSGGVLHDMEGSTIRIVFDNRGVADKLPPSPSVAQYAWNANSYPGNEYWTGQHNASDQAAMASCTFTPELHNPDVNREAFHKSRVPVVATDA